MTTQNRSLVVLVTAKTHEMGEDHERKLIWQRVPKQSATK